MKTVTREPQISYSRGEGKHTIFSLDSQLEEVVVQIQNVSIYNSNSNLEQEPITLVMGSCLEKMT